MTAFVRRRFDAWLEKRSPPCSHVELNQRRIFIIPSRGGAAYLLMLLCLLILAINYQNNLIFALTFWLFSLLLVAILHTFANLSGITLRAGAAEPVFAGQLASFHLHLEAGGRDRHRLHLGFTEQAAVTCSLDAKKGGSSVILKYPALKRGAMRPSRMTITTRYPLGILRCWSAPKLDWHCLVYPQARLLRPLVNSATEGEGSIPDISRDGDEFTGFQLYQPGQPPRRIFWKAYAKGQVLQTKQFEQSQSDELILDWNELDGLGVEERLSTLCAWALDCNTRGLSFGLQMPGVKISAASGGDQLTRVLRALALY
ncbi:DUF58 domain-containing protein [Zhongshania aquimaris]|uniref:DUF58 domain-containing protein n=1 Tax=Zhongshania aquimaris TaxID=2857107 RepID=A0ABS6VLY9_9GAMM|nr:DUF58 domain-containing protein [Zhongshania aquimaris]MBW2939332.1 DUF58 domain-containing protein [Zhongshania aquimaris]